jgi:hypothetical protein
MTELEDKLVWLIGGLLLSPLANARTAGSLPYDQIPVNNVFRLKSPPEISVEAPHAPLPSIKLTGIATILGFRMALLEIQFPTNKSQPAEERFYMFAEHQREGPVEVREIDETTGKVKLTVSGTDLTLSFGSAGVAPPEIANKRKRISDLPKPAQNGLRKAQNVKARDASQYENYEL